jgi:DNA-binding SARP family transcriptional activator/TolB-like protein
MTIRIQTLGPIRAFKAGIEVTGVEGLRLRAALLVYLAVERSASRDALVSMFWPEKDEAHARQALRQNIHELRRLLGAGWIELRGRELRVADSLTTDLGGLEAAIDQREWATAARAFGGPFLDGVHLLDLASWERWVDAKRAHAARLFRKACREWVAECQAEGDQSGAVEAALAWVGRDPSDDEAQHTSIEALAAAGRRTEAMRQYDSYTALLAADGLTPLDQTQNLIERMSRRSLPASGDIRGLSTEHDTPSARVEPAPPTVAFGHQGVAEASHLSDQHHSGMKPPVRRLAVLAVVIAVSVVSLRGVGFSTRQGSKSTNGAFEEAKRVAVMPFSYRGSERYAHLGDAVMVLLSKTLDTGTELRTVDPRAISGALDDSVDTTLQAGRIVASRLHADNFLLGEIVEVGGRLHVTARLHSSHSPEIDPMRASVDGVPDSLFALIDNLSAQLLLAGHEAGHTPVVRTAAVTTESLDALVSFLEGERLYRGMNGRYGRGTAYDAFHRAVEIDSTFALAWYRLSHLAYFSGAALSRVVDFADAASRHTGGLPWRERQLITANQLYAHGAATAAERMYREILRTYPDDVEAWFGLMLVGGYNWLLGDSYQAQREAALRVLQYEPEHFVARWATVWSAASDRDWSGADSLMRLMWGGDPIPWEFQAVLAFGGSSAEARPAMVSSIRSRPTGAIIGTMRWVNWYAQNPAAAREFALVLDDRDEAPQVKALARLYLAEYELALGRWRAARHAFDRLAAVNPAWGLADRAYHTLAKHLAVDRITLEELRDSLLGWDAGAVAPITPAVQGFGVETVLKRHDGVHAHVRLYLLGRLSVRLGDHNRALEAAADVERLTAPADAGTISRDLAQSIRAHLLADQGRQGEALAVIEEGTRQVPFNRRHGSWIFTQPQDRLLRAELLASLGRLDEADRWLRSVAYIPESVLAGPAHLARAELFERTRQPEKALVEYRRLVELWHDADAEFQTTVTKARERIRHIESSSGRN